MPKIDPILVNSVAEIIHDHEVTTVISWDWGKEEVPYCRSCHFFGTEDPALHTATVLLEYLEGYYEERYSNAE